MPLSYYLFKRAPCHQSKERLRVAEVGDGLQTWRAATNI